MAIQLADKYAPYTDELFATESKLSLMTNNEFDWTGAKTIKVYKVSTSDMNDYGRTGPKDNNWSRYGAVKDLDATTESMTLEKDRSFTFTIDKLDNDETVQQVQAATALARQLREKVVPEVDTYVYAAMADKAGHKPDATVLTAENIYDQIILASKVLDDSEVPETERFTIVTPAVFNLMKKCPDIMMETNIANEMRLRGVIATIDGTDIIKVPEIRLPDGFGFIMGHKIATVAPVKLEDYTIHENPPGINGSLVEGRINYDAFVLDNKKVALYYQTQE